MTTPIKNTETEKETGRFENIKHLNAMNQQGEVSILINNVKDIKRRLDGLLNEQRERERAIERSRMEEQRKAEQAAEPAVPFAPPPVSATKRDAELFAPETPAPLPKADAPDVSAIKKLVKSEVSPAVSKPKIENINTSDGHSHSSVVQPIKNHENTGAASAPVSESVHNFAGKPSVTGENAQTPATPSVSSAKPAATENINGSIRTKQFGATPSYVRGVMAPPPPPKPSVPYQRPGSTPYQQRPGGGAPYQQRPGGAPYQQRPGGAPYQQRPGGGAPYQQRPGGAPYQQRPGNFTPGQGRPPMGGAGGTFKKPMLPKSDMSAPLLPKDRKVFDKKKEYIKPADDKKSMNKRTLIRKGFIQEDIDDERMGTRKLKNRKIKEQLVFMPIKIEKAIITTENLTVKILSEKIGKTAQEIIKQLMVLGIMTTINSVVDFSTMELVASELGVELELKLEKTKEEMLEAIHDNQQDSDEDLVKRPPVITVMGHVDHGKTSLLDAIKKTTVASGEAGGITQHIGAYSVICKNEKITFLDTPGHEAFTEMRARGAKVTDIAVLVVAADDGVMPQTIEAINHAKAAQVPIIVAINKIDKQAANVEKIKQALTEFGLVTEEWGGDTMMVPLSAKTGDGIDKLLETILFLAEYNAYKANPARSAKGAVIEAKLDKGKGPIANVIVQNGTLFVGDYVVSGMTSGRVRALVDDKGRSIKEAGPSTPVSILGFTDVPNAGDPMMVVSDEKIAKQVIAERTNKFKNEQANSGQKVTLDDVFNKISEGMIKELNIVVKGDVQGSVEALKNSLIKLSNEEVKVSVIHGGVGAINKSDLMLAEVSKAIIVGFNVRPDAESRTLAESSGIDVRIYHIIYEALDDIQKAMKGLLAPKYREINLGRAQVRSVFRLSSVGIVAGSYVLSGKMVRGAKIRIHRENKVIYEGSLSALKRFKDDVKEVNTGYECGISIDGYSDFMENDEIEAYALEEIV